MELDPHTCRILLSCWDDRTYIVPGGFEEKLFALIAHADTNNRAKLSVIYPKAVHAANVYNYKRDGRERVIEAAETSFS